MAVADIIDGISLHLMPGPDRYAEVTLGRHKDFGLIGDREVRLLRLLAPHLRRAVIISDLIDMKSIEAEMLSHTLDRCPLELSCYPKRARSCMPTAPPTA